MPQSPYVLAPVPNGSDDTQSLQNAINSPSLPDGAVMMFPWQAAYKVSSPIKVYSRAAVRLISMSQPDTLPIGSRGTEFIWTGNGGVAMFDANFAHRVTFEGFAFSFDGNATPPACAIRFDQWPDSSMPAPSITDCTDCTVERCLFTGPRVAGTFHGLDFSQASKQNVDFMKVRHSIFNGGAEGIRFGSNSNQKSDLVQDCQFNGCVTGVNMLSGMLTVRNCGFEDCGARASGTTPAVGHDIRVTAASQFCLLEGIDSESTQGLTAIWLESSNCCFEVRNSRWDDVEATAVMFAKSTNAGGAVTLAGCEIGTCACSMFPPSPRTATKLVLRDNLIGAKAWNGTDPFIPNQTYPGLMQFGEIDIKGSGF